MCVCQCVCGSGSISYGFAAGRSDFDIGIGGGWTRGRLLGSFSVSLAFKGREGSLPKKKRKEKEEEFNEEEKGNKGVVGQIPVTTFPQFHPSIPRYRSCANVIHGVKKKSCERFRTPFCVCFCFGICALLHLRSHVRA